LFDFGISESFGFFWWRIARGPCAKLRDLRKNAISFPPLFSPPPWGPPPQVWGIFSFLLIWTFFELSILSIWTFFFPSIWTFFDPWIYSCHATYFCVSSALSGPSIGPGP